MAARSFRCFADASAFAKTLAREQRRSVRIVRHGTEFFVDNGSALQPNSGTVVPTAIPADARLCIDCGVIIDPARVKATPSAARCLQCQVSYEKNHDTRVYIDEGLPGTRDGHKTMRSQLSKEIRDRGQGR